MAALTQVARSMPYSTGGNLSNLRPEARADLMRIGLRSGHAVGVYQTTEGAHNDPRHNGTSANHPEWNSASLSGLGVDVNQIDGVDIGSYANANPEAAGLVESVKNAAESVSGVRTVLGPSGHTKSNQYGGARTGRSFSGSLKDQHQSHFHITFYRATERN